MTKASDIGGDQGGASPACQFFARTVVDSIKHGGIWVAPASGATFRVYHDAATGDGGPRSGRLVYEAGSCRREDEAEFLRKTITAFGAVGYSVFEDGAALTSSGAAERG